MQCQNCGANNPDSEQICQNCGNRLTEESQSYQQSGNQSYNQFQGSANARMSAKEFYNHPSMKGIKMNLRGAAIILYVCAGLTFIVNGIIQMNLCVVIDVILIAGCALGIQLAKSRICAILILIYSCINSIVTMVISGRPAGVLIILAAFYSVTATFNYHKLWKSYQDTGII